MYTVLTGLYLYLYSVFLPSVPIYVMSFEHFIQMFSYRYLDMGVPVCTWSWIFYVLSRSRWGCHSRAPRRCHPPSSSKQARKQQHETRQNKHFLTIWLTPWRNRHLRARPPVSNDPTLRSQWWGESRENANLRGRRWAEVFVLVGIYCWFRKKGRK